jgi:hypothetical protein
LKKRSKKLLFHGRSRLSTSAVPIVENEEPWNKSFLLLFFKKEVLSYLLCALKFSAVGIKLALLR